MTRWTWHHVTVFLLCFVGFALLHACRKTFSNIKDTFEMSITPENISNPTEPYDLWEKRQLFSNIDDANVYSATLDTLFLFAYAIGLYTSGIIGDRLNLRYLFSGGMALSSLTLFIFGFLTEITQFRNKYFYPVVYFLCGLFQAAGWPATVAIIGNWFGKSHSGLIFGALACGASIGNIFGSLLVSSVLDYGYEYGVLLTSFTAFCASILLFVCLHPSPAEIGLDFPDASSSEVKQQYPNDDQISGDKEDTVPCLSPRSDSEEQAIGLLSAVLLPGVIPYSLAYACLKFVDYSFLFWLPLYLVQGLGWKATTSDEISNFFDAGSLTGGICAGIISDYLGKRSPVMVTALILSVGTVLGYSNVGRNHALNAAVMFLTAFTLGGPFNLISSAIAADIGRQAAVEGNKKALATVAGIVDGTGSVGAAVGQIVVSIIKKKYSWKVVFKVLLGMLCLSVICILPMLYKDIKEWCDKWRMKRREMKVNVAEDYPSYQQQT